MFVNNTNDKDQFFEYMFINSGDNFYLGKDQTVMWTKE